MNETKHLEILLVEDDPHDIELLLAALGKELPCRVSVAFTPFAFETHLKQRPDIIISDSRVRALNGLAILRIAKQVCPTTPFVFCCGNNSETMKEQALALGAAAFVPKQASFKNLISAVKEICADRPAH